MKQIDNIGGVILAAGESSRLGFPKQLVQHKNTTLLEHIIFVAMESQLDPIIVVLGANHQQIAEKIANYPIQIRINNNWQKGIASSIVTGVRGLPHNLDGVIMFVADQPFLTSKLVKRLIKNGNDSVCLISAPRVKGVQTNPVYFNKSIFGELLNLKGDQGGRDIIKKHSVKWINIDDEKLLVDIDKIEHLNYLTQLSSSNRPS